MGARLRGGDARPGGAGPTPDFIRQVRDALAHLHDLPYLQTHALVRYLPADAGPTIGKALQQALLAVIEALAPGAIAGQLPTTVRIHRLLMLRYVEGYDAGEVWAELGIGKSEYYREHGRGVQAVTAILAARIGVRPVGVGGSRQADRPTGDNGHSRGNLPLPRTSFIGRDQALAEVGPLLDAVRLLTLTGAGGVGKSRLALEVARAARASFSEGVWLVELAPLADPTLVPQAIARALSIGEQPDRPLIVTLVAALAPGQRLLVLDNCEHVLDGCAPLVDTLLRGCPGLRVLATGRERLRLSGEQEYPVPPLAVPDPRQPRSPEGLGKVAAVQLFVERARAVRPDFRLTEANAAAVAGICAWLDGLPLALELAAARIRLFPPAALLALLERRLALLVDGPRDLPARQRTMHDTIAWSYALLTADEQHLFRRLAVFAGGNSLDAADAVCNATGDLDLVAALDSLVSKSLVRQTEQPGGEARFTMMETIREFALDQLAALGEEAALRRQHAQYFLALVEASGAVLVGTTHERQRLASEQDNIRAALYWLVQHG